MKALGRLTLLQCSFDGALPEIQEDELVHFPSFLYEVLPLSLLLMASQDLFHEETMKRQTPYCPGGRAENNCHQPAGRSGRCWVRGTAAGSWPELSARPSWLPAQLNSRRHGLFHSVLFSNSQGCARSCARRGGGSTGRRLAPGSLWHVGPG